MKKQNEVKNEVKNETPAKPKRQRKEHLFFLYATGKGFIRMDEGDSMPNFENGELMNFPTKSGANFARDFLLNMKVAEEISIFAKIA